jgi:hypothetical protein
MTSAGFIVRDPLEGFSSFGLNAFTVPAHELFRINGLAVSALEVRPFLVRDAKILRQAEPEMCPHMGIPHLHEAEKVSICIFGMYSSDMDSWRTS